MKQWMGLLAAGFFGGVVSAAVVDAEKAAAVALAFAEQNAILAEHTEGVGEATTWENVWVVPLVPSGYVVIEKDDLRPPVIAFGTEDFPAVPPDAMAALLARPAVEEGVTPLSTLSTTPAHEEWAMLLAPSVGLETLADKKPPEGASYQEIDSFEYFWNQSLPYNLYAPGVSRERVPYTGQGEDRFEALTESTYGLRSACGCVATAMSQVGAWFQWPYALRGVTICEQKGNLAEGADPADTVYPTHQVATPGKPYNWKVLDDALQLSGVKDETDGEEVGRFVQHWATMVDMSYYMDAAGGTGATCSRPDLLLLAGYKVVTPEGVGDIMAETASASGKWETKEMEEYTPERFKALYGAFKEAIETYDVPAATGIAGHYIVCSGWGSSKQVDTVLGTSEDVYYAKLNYGWGPTSFASGWYTLRMVVNEGDGETVATDGMVFLQECFTMLPLQCGEIVNLSKVGSIPTTLEWYEAPYWSEKYLGADRMLQVVTFKEDTPSRSLSLKAAAKSDANWNYTSETDTETGTVVSERLEMDQTRAGLRTAVLFPELLKASDAVSITVDLERMTYKASDGTESTVPDLQARDLLLALEDAETGMLFYKKQLTLGDDVKTKGTFNVELSTTEVAKDKVFRVLLVADKSPLDNGTVAIPVDTLAYAVTGVTVNGCYASEKKTSEIASVEKESSSSPGALVQGTLSDEAKQAITASKTAWLAVTIETGTEHYDAMWKSLTIAENAVALPTIAFEESRLFLNKLDTSIAFTVSDNVTSVKAYFSQGTWLKEAYRGGFDLTDELKAKQTVTDEDGNTRTVVTFTLEKYANTDKAKPAGGVTPDAMTLDSVETVGRDTLVSLCATDAAGNQAWTHVRLTWGYSDGMIALLKNAKDPDRELMTAYLDRLLFAVLYAGCYKWGKDSEGASILVPKSKDEITTETATTWEITEEKFAEAMDFVEDTIRFGYATEGNTLSENLFTYMLLNADAADPRIEILNVSPGASSTEITFQMSIDTASTLGTPEKPATSTKPAVPTAATSSATLAQYVDTTAITVEGGATLDEPLKKIEGATLNKNDDGTYTLTLPKDKNFFQIKL